MEQRPLDITLISAKGLKDVGAFSKMDVYVSVSISTNPSSEQKTPVDEDGGSSPKWNHLMRFTVDEPSVQMNRAVVVFKLKHERKLMGDKDVGEVHVSVKELLDKAGGEKGKDVPVEYSVKTASGKDKGTLKFSYKFFDVYKIEQPAYAPPPAYAPQHDSQKTVDPYPQQQAPGYYPPPVGYPMQGGPSGPYAPQPAYATPYAAPPGGYPQAPPPQYGYGGGYQQPPPMGYQGGYQGGYAGQKPKKSGGMGAGAGLALGLAGGLVGGMIVEDMIDDAFDDGGDF